MKTIKVSEATGAVLDWMVAKCQGHVENGVYGEPVLRDGQLHIHYCGVVLDDAWCPTTSWAQGGPIIERERLNIVPTSVGWEAYPDYGMSDELFEVGPTPLIAAMRCYVASKLGDECEVPDELH